MDDYMDYNEEISAYLRRAIQETGQDERVVSMRDLDDMDYGLEQDDF